MQYQCNEKDSEPSQQSCFSDQGRFDPGNLPWIREVFNRFPPEFCEYSLANLFAWGPIYDYRWLIHKGRLIVYDGRNNIMMMPVGCAMTPEELYALSHDMMDQGLSSSICLVPKAYLIEHPAIFDYFTVEVDRDSAEYIYTTQNLVHLNSEKLHKKKNLVSQFHRAYPESRVRVMDESLRSAALDFVQGQLDAMAAVPQPLEEEFEAMKRAFDHWTALGLGGLAVTDHDRLVAFSVYSRLNKETFNIHFEKSDHDIKGAAQVINQETAIALEGQCVYLNREQDLGIPGLRQAKLSYEPYRLLVSHLLRLKANA